MRVSPLYEVCYILSLNVIPSNQLASVPTIISELIPYSNFSLAVVNYKKSVTYIIISLENHYPFADRV